MAADTPARSADTPLDAGRVAAFADAVVAIAMTLLILPLMESVGEVDADVHEWFAEHHQQLQSFVISFLIIAMFWMNQHRLFAAVRAVTVPLMWLLIAWLLSIVWLPVATAMSGQMEQDDDLLKTVYIGSMILTSGMSLLCRLYLRAHPALHDSAEDSMRAGIIVDVSMIVLFGAALLIAVLVPAVGMWALLLMTLTGVVQNLLERSAGRG